VADALASLAAVTLDRARSLRNESRAEAARQSERLRTAIVDALAHEVATPLTSIRAASSGMLAAGGLKEYQTELLTLIDHECERLTRITQEMLRTAKLDSREVQVRRGSVDLQEVMTEIVRVARQKAPMRVLTVVWKDAECAVMGEESLIVAALSQLVDNAFKYSPADTPVSVGVKREDGEIWISVHNTGSHIPSDELERIFERFYRSESAGSNVPGTGLGLSIARKIATAHNGRVWAASDKEKGTTFYLALAAQKSEEQS
jgi:two-component system sensor histidine kinase KdpD